MFGLIASVYFCFIYALFDFIIYILVDIAVKACLREASDDNEKRVIWLWESGLLAAGCLVVYAWHHTPWILALLTLLTFLYTQLLGRINFRYWWWQLATRWDEFEQHEESMEVYNSRNINPPNVSVQPGQTPPFANRWSPSMMPVTSMVPPMQQGECPQAEPWYDSNSQKPMPVFVPVSAANAEMRYRGPPEGGFQPAMPSPAFNSPYTPIMPRGQDLVRRPLHPTSSQRKKSLGLSSKLKATIMNAFGMGQASPGPPGLQNNGQNLCFINAVLQCLAHSPALSSTLAEDVTKMASSVSKPERLLVSSVVDILQGLNSDPQEWEATGSSSLSIGELRKAASQLNRSLVLDPQGGVKQGQQDSAEFLMWVLDALHRALNVQHGNFRKDSQPGENSLQPGSQPRYANWTLQMLKYIYGDLTPQRIQELKLSCRKEIEQANGLDNDSYAEPIQRLSDLEWLTYKEQNRSVVDDLFTGQLVEVQHCTACNRISVGIQTFSILPVPIVGPRHLNGIVYLDDCFTKFGTVEELFGPEGLHCEGCNRSFHRPPLSPDLTPRPPAPIRRNLRADLSAAASPELVNGRPPLTDSALGATALMSPIPPLTNDLLSDSGFHDNQFKTSTPIGGGAPRVKLTEGQRRSLLRQLPECLVVQLLRFSFHQGQPRKICRPVSIPLTQLDLTGLIIDNVMRREDLTALNACFQYSLYGLVLHLGGESTSYGHYVSYALAANNAWYKFDDQMVTSVNMEYELNTRQVRENAYLLFYKKSVSTP